MTRGGSVPTTIKPVRLNHINAVVEDFDRTVQHFRAKYDAQLVADLPQKEMHACLMTMGGALFEFFIPHAYLLNARYGPHYLGVEYQADMQAVRRAVAERGMRIVRDIDIALHTHPADGFGVSYEFYHDHFLDRDWPLLGGRVKSAEYWLTHPLGLTGLKGYTHAVSDIRAASEFLQSFLGGEPIYDADRSNIAARAVGMKVGSAVVELLTPTASGELARHISRHGEGIRSAVFGVSNLVNAERYLAGRGLQTVSGGAPGTLAVGGEANLGLMFEFTE
jgi:hypothetical protein